MKIAAFTFLALVGLGAVCLFALSDCGPKRHPLGVVADWNQHPGSPIYQLEADDDGRTWLVIGRREHAYKGGRIQVLQGKPAAMSEETAEALAGVIEYPVIVLYDAEDNIRCVFSERGDVLFGNP